MDPVQRLSRLATPWILTTVTACAPAERAAPETVVRDSAGIRIVENPAGEPEVRWKLTDAPTVDIGGIEGESLFQIVSAIRVSDGRIVVGNSGTSELRYYHPDGTFIRSVGRDGDGPGEFRQIMWMGRRAADTVIVFDIRLRRLSVFDGHGAFVRSFRLETTEAVPFSYVTGMYADGSFLAQGFDDTGEQAPDGLQRHDAPLYHFGPEGMLLEDLGLFPGVEIYYVRFASGGFSVFPALFGRHTYRVAVGDRLYVAANDTYELRRYRPDGTLNSVIRRAHEPVPVTSEHVRIERESRLARRSQNDRDVLANALDAMEAPETFPAYRVVRGDEAGNLWVQDYPIPSERSARWTVFDSTGVMRAAVELPVAFEPTHIGDEFVVGIWRDELETEHVRVYGLQRF